MQESKIMSSEDCAAFIINAVKNKKRLAIGSWRGKIGRWIKLIAPGLIDVFTLKTIDKKH
jgi:hypothetical protein